MPAERTNDDKRPEERSDEGLSPGHGTVSPTSALPHPVSDETGFVPFRARPGVRTTNDQVNALREMEGC